MNHTCIELAGSESSFHKDDEFVNETLGHPKSIQHFCIIVSLLGTKPLQILGDECSKNQKTCSFSRTAVGSLHFDSILYTGICFLTLLFV